MFFKLVGANHVDENNITYKPGDIVKSEDDLVKLFPNKFTEVDKNGNPVEREDD